MSVILIMLVLTVIGIPAFFILADFLHEKQMQEYRIEVAMVANVHWVIKQLGLSKERDND